MLFSFRFILQVTNFVFVLKFRSKSFSLFSVLTFLHFLFLRLSIRILMFLQRVSHEGNPTGSENSSSTYLPPLFSLISQDSHEILIQGLVGVFPRQPGRFPFTRAYPSLSFSKKLPPPRHEGFYIPEP